MIPFELSPTCWKLFWESYRGREYGQRPGQKTAAGGGEGSRMSWSKESCGEGGETEGSSMKL